MSAKIHALQLLSYRLLKGSETTSTASLNVCINSREIGTMLQKVSYDDPSCYIA